MHNFLPLGRLQNLDRNLISELGLNLEMDSIEINAIVAFLDAADVFNTSQIEYFLFVYADDASLVNLHKHFLFVKYNALDLTSSGKDYA